MVIRYSHPLMMVTLEVEDNKLCRITLSLPDPSTASDDHPFCHVVETYLNGHDVLWPPYDETRLTPFQRRVFSQVCRIPFGQVRTYQEIAHLVGYDRAPRAVARALATNPLPLVIPCHRVVSSRFPRDLGGYTPEPSLKRLLLTLEGVILP